MPNAGYSGTPLIKKLGIKDDMKVLLMNAPENYFELIEKNISHQFINKKETPDFVHVFVQSKKEFEKEINKIFVLCKKNPMIIIWVSWYKKVQALQQTLLKTKCAITDYKIIWLTLKYAL